MKRIKLSQVKFEHFLPLQAEHQGFAREINPRTYTQIDTPTEVQGGADGAPPWIIDMLQYFETIFPSVESLWSSLQDEVYFFVSDLDNYLAFSQPLSYLYQAMQTRKTFPIA